uniref:Tc1-like transposase DDE domain-containing protein n=1 Tax=Panagrolaimus davidi TaxID=227884 RepID=A0A914PTW3_9BILA
MTIKLGKKVPFVWTKKGQQVPHVGQLVHGKGVHVWAGISWNGPTGIIIWDSKCRMDGNFYCKNIIPEVIKSGQRLFDGEYQLVQDNHPAHVSAATMDVIEENNIQLFPHPPQSPDFNAIEFLWRDLKIVRDKINPRTKAELVQLIIKFWKTKVTPSYCRTLIRHACKNIERSFDGLNHEKDTPTNKIYHH